MPLFFALTLFLSAVLLFVIQPMIAKAILPLLGGTPSVWNTCMVFFQAVLLAGYAYAHATTGWLGVRKQTLVHAVLLLSPFLVLPIAVREAWVPEGQANPVFGVLGLLAVSVGLPFFVVSTTAPLVQKWFAGTGHPSASDPYYLYAASNLGSMVGLNGYIAVVEPLLPLAWQNLCWAAGYGVFVACMFGCALMVRRSRGNGENTRAWEDESAKASSHPPTLSPSHAPACSRANAPTRLRRLHWVALAFVPSSLMLGVTTLITLDIAAIPLLWVLPLDLYLLSFILVFSRLPDFIHKLMIGALPIVALTVVFVKVFALAISLIILLHLLVLFVVAMVCHGELARSRPPTEHLTEFYLWMSLGGVLGGLFNALVAPVVFNDVIEYYVVLALAGLMLPSRAKTTSGIARALDVVLPIGLAGLALIMIHGLPKFVGWIDLDLSKFEERLHLKEGRTLGILTYLPLFVICYVFVDRPVRFGLGLGALTAVILISLEGGSKVLHRERSFFGVVKVTEERIRSSSPLMQLLFDPDGGRLFHSLAHGTTLHGMQNREPGRRREAVTYYHNTGPIGQLFEAIDAMPPRKHYAVVGLGTGSLAAYAQEGEDWTYYEIDPTIERIARNSDYFSFLNDCPANLHVVLGDARLKLKEAPDGRYGLILVDAFSSDAIPMHLLTREAIELYFKKLGPDGLLALHISNRHLDLEPVAARLAEELKLTAVVRSDKANPEVDAEVAKTSSQWVVFGRKPEHLGKLMDDEHQGEARWKVLKADDNAPLWTDDFPTC